jgi:hypothetical protein
MAADEPQPPQQHRMIRFGSHDRWSRTALVGLAAVAGLTVLGVVGTVAGKLTGSDLVALGGTFAAILGTVAGRSSTPGAST